MSRRSASPQFLRYLTPAKKTKQFSRKKEAFKFELSRGQMDIRGITRHGQSPVAGEGEPQWEMMLHARERKGEPFISGIYRMSIVDYSTVIMLMTFALCRKLECNPVDFMRRMTVGMENCIKSGGIHEITEGEDTDAESEETAESK